MAEGMSRDVVYVVRPGDINEELRYSMRSLENVPHGNVVIAGHLPPWAMPNLYLRVYGDSNKYRSVEANLAAALLSDQVSDPFYLFNDDFFLMKKMRTIPTLHRGRLKDVISAYRKRPNGIYLKGMEQALALLQGMGIEDPYSYEMHSPLLVHKKTMLATLALRGSINCYHLRTVYGNLQKLKGKQSEDVKIYRNSSVDFTRLPMLSTGDMSFKYQKVGLYIRRAFPQASPWEAFNAQSMAR